MIIRNYQLFSAVFTFILGTVLHFTYKWSNENKVVAVFSSINESTWEHLKLIFYPMFLITIIGYFYIGKDIPNFLCAKTIGIISAMLFTVIFFYTYTGILGKNIAVIDIASFFVSIGLGEYISFRLMLGGFECNSLISIISL